MQDTSTFQHESQLKCEFNWLFILIFNIHIQSDEYASCPKMATFSCCYLLGVNVNIKMYKSDKIKMYNYSKLT